MIPAAGYVYVAALSNGTVKVGRSQDAGRRLGTHRANARTLGLTVTDSWSSPLHAEWYPNEDALKKIAADLGGVPESRETFSGIAFADVVSKAEGLTFTAPETPEVPAAPAAKQVLAQSSAPPIGPSRRDLDLGTWVMCTGVLGSPLGRARLEKIRMLLDAISTPQDGALLQEHVADEFTALLREIGAETTRFAQAVAETRAFRLEFEKEQARKAAA